MIIAMLLAHFVGELGLGGIRDRHQILCFALALWNSQDPILKERSHGAFETFFPRLSIRRPRSDSGYHVDR